VPQSLSGHAGKGNGSNTPTGKKNLVVHPVDSHFTKQNFAADTEFVENSK
jgi:hypothetical protein